MNYKTLLPLASLALLVSCSFTACQKDEPKSDDPALSHQQDPPAPAVPLPALRAGELRVAVPQAGGLQQALAGQDLSGVHILLLTSGTLNQADLDFVRRQMKALEELDMSRVTLAIGDDDYGLKDNKTIKKLIAPASLRRTADGWFSYTRAEEIVFPGDQLRIFGGALFNERVKRITLPESVETILPQAFWNNHQMESITLPSRIKVIPTRCFYFCRSLQAIEIPASVTEIQDEAFAACTSLQRITFLGQAPALQRNDQGQTLSPFASVVWEQDGQRKCVIRVPRGQVQHFLDKWQWPAERASRFEEF